MNPEVHYRPYISSSLVPTSTRSIQSPRSQPTSVKFILILSSHLRLGLPRGLFPSGYPTKTLYACLDNSMHATSPAYLSSLIMLGEEYNACSSVLCNFLHSTIILSFLAPYIFLKFILEHS